MWSELTSTHYWDCNGGACDAPMLQPWNERLYSFAPQYAPQRPPGGTGQYGETLWLVGAASDSLSKLLGGDDECCGRDDTNVGGCGRCILARNPLAQSNLTAVIMKKSRCPPETNLCSEGSVHMDIAVPGFEFISESTANVCGSADRLQTWLTKAQSGACATSTVGSGCDCSWTMAKTNCGTDDGSQCWSACCAPTSPTTDGASSCCDQIVANGRPARQRLFDGCELFRAWGWPSGAPTLQYQTVACPAEFVARVSAAFTADGVADVQGHPHLPVAPPLPPVSPLPAPLPPPPPPREGLTQGGILSIILGVIVLFVMYLVWGRCQCNICTKCPRSNSRPGQGSSVPDVTQVATKRVRGSFGASRASGGAYNASYGAPPAAPRGEVGNGVSAGVELAPPLGLVEASANDARVEVL